MPAETSSIASITASVLPGVLVRCRSLPATKPVTMPMKIGSSTSSSTTATGIPSAERFAETSATIRKNTSAPTRSSSAAMGISVRVTGPSVFRSLTTESEGAGAVASAMLPNRSAR